MLFRGDQPTAPGVLTLRLGLGAAHAVERVAGASVLLKWPNDLFIGERKVGGILCEGAVEPGKPGYVVAGIGLNLSQPDVAWPPDLRGTATSLAVAGYTVDRAALAGALVQEWLRAAARDPAGLSDTEIAEFDRRDALLGRPITVDNAPAGIAASIARDGALLARVGGGIRTVVSGTVRTSAETPEP